MTSYYRYLTAGSVATKALLDDRELLSAVKTANQTVTNSTVNVADTVLTLPVAANATYHVSLLVIASGPAAADWKQQWTFPAGSTGQRFTHGPETGTTSTQNTKIQARSAPIATSIGYGTDGSDTSVIREEVWLVTAGTAGNFALTWSQLVANASGTTVWTGSYMTARRVV
jgi:hypothetical protein